MKKECAIGIFDSGLGGLTVAHALKMMMPNERLIYFGDTAHLPYGDKSAEAIRFYSKKISAFLIEKKVKSIVIACNTASAMAYSAVKEYVNKHSHGVRVFNVIDPVVEYVANNSKLQRIGVIGTKGTINSGAYQIKLKQKIKGKEIVAIPTPMFVPMIEEGFIYDDISNAIIRAYLSNEKIRNINALVLGCTHYPIIKNQIRKFYNFNVQVIDSSQIVASHIKNILAENNLINNETSHANDEFFISDYTDYFSKIAGLFFEENIKLKKIKFWEK